MYKGIIYCTIHYSKTEFFISMHVAPPWSTSNALQNNLCTKVSGVTLGYALASPPTLPARSC